MNRTVLIIDDEIDLCLLIKSYLNKKNYTVFTAHTLSEGFEKLASLRPDVLILDNNLPDGMGWKEVENIHGKFPDMHITLLSAYEAPKDLVLNSDMPIRVLEKPISINDIEDSFNY